MLAKNWNWRRQIPSWDYDKIALSKYNWPGWEKSENGEPYFTRFSTVSGKHKSSYDMAVLFDDIATGVFYYRDFTSDELPYVDAGEKYESLFVFQFKSDKELFDNLLNESR